MTHLSQRQRAAMAWLNATKETTQHAPEIHELQFGSRGGKAFVRFSQKADLSIFGLVEDVVCKSFGGESCRVNVGLLGFGRKLAVGNVKSLLLVANPHDGTYLMNNSWLPPWLSRRSRRANELVREIAQIAKAADDTNETRKHQAE